MSVAKTVEISAQSPESFEAAMTKGIERATDTIEDIQGAWIKEMKVDVQNGKISMFRVHMNVTFVLKK